MNPHNKNLVPGGLAMVISSKIPENVGAVVTIIRFDPGSSYDVDCEAKEPLIAWRLSTFERIKTRRGWFRSSNLMPINPEPDPLEINQEEQQEQKA